MSDPRIGAELRVDFTGGSIQLALNVRELLLRSNSWLLTDESGEFTISTPRKLFSFLAQGDTVVVTIGMVKARAQQILLPTANN